MVHKVNTLLKRCFEKAADNPAKIVYPEGEEQRIILALKKILAKNIAIPILLGRESQIRRLLKANSFSQSQIEKITIIDPSSCGMRKRYADYLFQKRKHKSLSRHEAEELVLHPNYFGTVMVAVGDADALISGAVHTTADTVRPALQLIRVHEKYHKVSGLFLMLLEDELLLFADCAVTIDPSAEELARIGVDSAKTAMRFGIKPKVAFLSFSTHGSASHPMVEKVQNAVKIFKRLAPKIPADGDLQVDAALLPEVRKRKAPNSRLKGRANVLIFPNLACGNISYKLVERLARAKAIGPILQGLKKPVNDLSRGCSVDDIVNLTAITTVDAKRHPKFVE
ncbi:phosphate acetyltransferase [Candidatus Woesearchaeota archaeon]|nr:MAG: phosphate acetyltransferase [Candidatus Woesearchaeota archaeon]